MSVYSFEPFFSFNDVHRLFDDVLSDTPRSSNQVTRRNGNDTQERSLSRGFQPRMDIHESPESNLVAATIELPGLKKEDVSIDIQGGRLVISGEHKESNEVNEKGYVLRERRSGRFHRALPLPRDTQVSCFVIINTHILSH
jgi:HSP20 family protein